jgi:hypothetical protein
MERGRVTGSGTVRFAAPAHGGCWHLASLDALQSYVGYRIKADMTANIDFVRDVPYSAVSICSKIELAAQSLRAAAARRMPRSGNTSPNVYEPDAAPGKPFKLTAGRESLLN